MGRDPDVGLITEAVIDLPGKAAVAYLVRAPDGRELPGELTLGAKTVYERLMDRFYVPVSPNTAVVSTLFDLIADLYDDLIGYQTNFDTSRHLLSLVLVNAPASAQILDFGCGTGIAREALKKLRAGVHIVGTDISNEMLRRARGRGEDVLAIDVWRAETKLYDGAIACFVMHYGVPDLDIVRIGNGLHPGARFAANFFKARPIDIERVIRLMAEAGCELVHHLPIFSTTNSENLALVFERPRC